MSETSETFDPALTPSADAAPGTATALGPDAAEPDPRRWWSLVIIALAQLMIVLDITVVTIALPSAQADLHIAPADKQWVMTAYTLAFGGLLLLGGKIVDFVGRKNTLIIGLIGFAGASALGGASVTGGMLFGARAVQGTFGALLAPAALSLLTTTFTDPNERAKAFGVFGAIAGAGSAIGLILGGVITNYLTWRWTMYVNVIIAIIAVVGAVALVVDRAPRHAVRVDYLGTVLGCGGLLALVYGFTKAASDGWTNSTTLTLFAVAIVALALFAVVENHVSAPLLPPHIVAERNRGGSFALMALAALSMFGVFLFLTYYLQGIKGYSALRTGFAFLPMSATLIFVSVGIAARLLTKLPPRMLLVPGMLIAACGMAWMTRISVGGSYAAEVLPAEILLGIGFGLTFMPVFATATSGVAPQDAGVTSATLNTSQQVGGSIGTALLNTIAVSASASYIVSHRLPPAAVAQNPATEKTLSYQALLGEAQAQVHGYVLATWAAVGFLVLAAIVGGVLINAGPMSEENIQAGMGGGG
ncbi:MFS transporter [Actinospica acidithermotolerans]|nr:MFS transporter [Actinospica acidithermotolerans]